MLSWQEMAIEIEKIQKTNAELQCCIGFDGYIDSLYHVVKHRNDAQNRIYYETITEFSSHIAQAAHRSADMELSGISRRMGGNAPIFAEALACLSLKSYCIGALGSPEIDPIFSPPLVHFTPISIAAFAQSVAFEFSDGKLMFGDVDSLQQINWEQIKHAVGLSECIRLYRSAELWGIVNWSFTLYCNDIIEGFIKEVIDACPSMESARKILFFDLADPTGRPKEDVLYLCGLLGELGKRTRVVLGLNENEACCLANILSINFSEENICGLAEVLREQLQIELLVIHGLDYAIGAAVDELQHEKSIYNKNPRISTGGGDNFNAGLCTALLYGLPLSQTLAFGNLVSSYYVTNGQSPTLENLLDYVSLLSNR